MSQKEPVILPPKYYLTYFEYLIGFIETHSEKLLGDADRLFIADFRGLSEDARCVLVRMANRKGLYFRFDRFSYEEISSVGEAVEELVEKNMVSLEPPADPSLFTLFTKKELDGLFPESDFNKKPKKAVLEELLEAGPEAYRALLSTYTIVHFIRQENVEFLKLLFFGNTHGMMTEFVIRDVGNIKLENLEGHTFTPWFESHEEARSVFELSSLSRTFWEMTQVLLPEEVLPVFQQVNWSTWLHYPAARKRGDRLLLRLGEYFEKAGFQEDSLAFYELSRKHPSRERRIRIYEKLNRIEDALELAATVLEHPLNASEHLFAKDFIAKKSKRNYRSTTQKLKDNPGITVPAGGYGTVEQKALEHFFADGYEGAHTENYLWRNLFGLLFWEELFHKDQATFHHPLQRMPSDLHDEFFFDLRGAHLQEKMTSIKSKKQLSAKVKATCLQKEGINNPLISWHPSSLYLLETCIRFLPLPAIKKVMLEISKNVRHNSTGFPDLFVWRGEEYQFYEIKSPNDHLSAQQLFWLDFFEAQKINASILRVYYS